MWKWCFILMTIFGGGEKKKAVFVKTSIMNIKMHTSDLRLFAWLITPIRGVGTVGHLPRCFKAVQFCCSTSSALSHSWLFIMVKSVSRIFHSLEIPLLPIHCSLSVCHKKGEVFEFFGFFAFCSSTRLFFLVSPFKEFLSPRQRSKWYIMTLMTYAEVWQYQKYHIGEFVRNCSWCNSHWFKSCWECMGRADTLNQVHLAMEGLRAVKKELISMNAHCKPILGWTVTRWGTAISICQFSAWKNGSGPGCCSNTMTKVTMVQPAL